MLYKGMRYNAMNSSMPQKTAYPFKSKTKKSRLTIIKSFCIQMFKV